MKTRKQKMLSVILALVMCLGLMPPAAFAAPAADGPVEGYATLTEAVEAMPADSQPHPLVLLRDVNAADCGADGVFSIPYGKHVKLDLNGFSIRTGKTIANEGKLTVVNSKFKEAPFCGIINSKTDTFRNNSSTNLSVSDGLYVQRLGFSVVPDFSSVTKKRINQYEVQIPQPNSDRTTPYYMVGEPVHEEDGRLCGTVLSKYYNSNNNYYSKALRVGNEENPNYMQVICATSEFNLQIEPETVSSMAAFGAELQVSGELFDQDKRIEMILSRNGISQLNQVLNGDRAWFGVSRTYGVDGADFSCRLTAPAMDYGNELTIRMPASAPSTAAGGYVFQVDRTSGKPVLGKLMGRAAVLVDSYNVSGWNTSGDMEAAVFAQCPHPNMKYYASVAPTCTSEGQLEAWHCPDCNRWYKDLQSGQLYENVYKEYALNLRKTAHVDQDQNGWCDVCGQAMPYFQKVTSQEQVVSGGTYLAVTEYEGSSYVMCEPTLNQNRTTYYLPSEQITVSNGIISYDDYAAARERSRAMDLCLNGLDTTFSVNASMDGQWNLLTTVYGGPFEFKLDDQVQDYDKINITAQQDQVFLDFLIRQDLRMKGGAGVTGYADPVFFLENAQNQLQKPELAQAVRLPVQLYQMVEPEESSVVTKTVTVIGGYLPGMTPVPGTENQYLVPAGKEVSAEPESDSLDTFTRWTTEDPDTQVTQGATGAWKFTMPQKDIVIRANYTDRYLVTVVNGTMPRYDEATAALCPVGSTVFAEANAVPEGYLFTGWTVEPDTVTLESRDPMEVTFQMPSCDVTLTANMELPAPHKINLTGGKAYQQESDTAPRLEVTQAMPGTLVELEAVVPEGYRFNCWNSMTEIGDPFAQSTYFTMPNEDVTIEASFTKDGMMIPEANIWTDQPVAGLTPDTEAQVLYTVGYEPPVDYLDAVETAVWTPTADKFAENTAYTVNVTLTAPKGYFFGANTVIYVNGSYAQKIGYVKDGVSYEGELREDGADAVTVAYTFPETGATEYLISCKDCDVYELTQEGSIGEAPVIHAPAGAKLRALAVDPDPDHLRFSFERFEATGVTLENTTMDGVDFVMPANPVEITAIFGEHKHTPGDQQYSDASGHWYKCADCGVDLERENHSFEPWLPHDDGSQTRTCTVCGYQELKPSSKPVVTENLNCNFVVIPPDSEYVTIEGTEPNTSVTYDPEAVEVIEQAVTNDKADGVGLEIQNITDQNTQVNEAQKETIESSGADAVYMLNLYMVDYNDEDEVIKYTGELTDFGTGSAVVRAPAPYWVVNSDNEWDKIEVVRVEEDGTKTVIEDVWMEPDLTSEENSWFICWKSSGHSVYMISAPEMSFAKVDAAQADGVSITLNRPCAAGEFIIAAGYDKDGRMICVDKYDVQTAQSAGAKLKIQGTGFDQAATVKVFLLSDTYAPQKQSGK